MPGQPRKSGFFSNSQNFFFFFAREGLTQYPRKAHNEKLSKDEQVESGLLVTEKNSLAHLTNSPLRSYRF